MIENSVGRLGVNSANDVRIVQCALNVIRARQGRKGIAIDGIVGPKTIGAISDFQHQQLLPTDGRIDVNGPTLKRLRSLLGEEAAVFAPVVTQLLGVLYQLDQLSLTAPPSAKSSYLRATSQLRAVSPFKNLTGGPPGESRVVLAGFRAGPPVIAAIGIDDAAEALVAMMVLALLLATILIILVESPAFRQAVEVRARELDSIMGELKVHMNVGFNDALQLILSITNDSISDSNRCRNSPTFTPSPLCTEAMAAFVAMVNRIRNQFAEVSQLVLLFMASSGRGFSVSSLRVQITRMLNTLRQNVVNLQVALADMKEKCNCPDI